MSLLRKIQDSPWYQRWIWKKRAGFTGDITREVLIKDAFLQSGFFFVKYRIIGFIVNLPGDIKYRWKMETQRAKRGWADSDAWGFDWYLSKVIVEGMTYLKKNKHGVPNACFEGLPEEPDGTHSPESYAIAEERWASVLDTIIFTFAVRQKELDHDLTMPWGETYFTAEELKKYQKFSNEMNQDDFEHRVMTRAEFERYQLGWKYFKKYFGSFWD